MVVAAFLPSGVKMAFLAGFNGEFRLFRAAPSATVAPVRDCVGGSWRCHGFVARLPWSGRRAAGKHFQQEVMIPARQATAGLDAALSGLASRHLVFLQEI